MDGDYERDTETRSLVMPHTPFHTTRSTGPGARTKREEELQQRIRRRPSRPAIVVEDPSDFGMVSRGAPGPVVLRPSLGRGGGSPAPAGGPSRGGPPPTPDPLPEGSYAEGGGGPGSAGYERFLRDYPDFAEQEDPAGFWETMFPGDSRAAYALQDAMAKLFGGTGYDIPTGHAVTRHAIAREQRGNTPIQVNAIVVNQRLDAWLDENTVPAWEAVELIEKTTGTVTTTEYGPVKSEYLRVNPRGSSEYILKSQQEEYLEMLADIAESDRLVQEEARSEEVVSLEDLVRQGEVPLPPIYLGKGALPSAPSEPFDEDEFAEELDRAVEQGKISEGVAEEVAEAAADEAAAEGEGGLVVLTSPFGDVGNIPTASYTKDPNETEWQNEADMAFVYREIIGLATKAELAAWGIGFDDSFDESQRLDPYRTEGLPTMGGTVPFGSAFERYGWSTDDPEGNAPGEIELNPPYPPGADLASFPEGFDMIYTKPAILIAAEEYLRSIGYSDEDLRLQRAAGWAFYNYSAEELRAAGRGGGGAPAGDAAQASATTGGGGSAFNDGGVADEYPWARDLRGHVARDFDASWNLVGGNAPAAWQSYLPKELNPDSIFVSVANALLPFLSQSDQRKMGRRLQLMVGDDGGFDGYDALPKFIYGTENWEDLIWNPDKWGDLVSTLYNLRSSLRGIAGPEARLLDSLFVELDWMIGAAKFIDDEYSGGPMTAWEIQDWTSTLTDLFQDAEGTGDPQNPGLAVGYGPLLKMLVEPYVPYLDSIFTGGVKEGAAVYR